jgi:hypothetical protein
MMSKMKCFHLAPFWVAPMAVTMAWRLPIGVAAVGVRFFFVGSCDSFLFDSFYELCADGVHVGFTGLVVFALATLLGQIVVKGNEDSSSVDQGVEA